MDQNFSTTTVSAAEQAIRIDLAAAYRLVALYGWDDLVFTHISARIPGPDHHFLINPYGMMFEEITATSLVKIGMDGMPIGDNAYAVNPAGFTIHSAVHEVREDAGCVMHLHTPDGTAVATSREGLQPLNQTAQLVIDDLAWTMTSGRACSRIWAARTSCFCAITARCRWAPPAPRHSPACISWSAPAPCRSAPAFWAMTIIRRRPR
jgi:hypothetical protein